MRLRRISSRIRGQISILIIFSLVPMFTLFAFAVNVGMLVQAKISLQNAADFAAYAGAATQARQLTHISHLNYMMREAYKKFLFRYYVMGNLSLKCFPGNAISGAPTGGCPNQPGDFNWINPNGKPYPGIPAVCISLSTTSNPCQLANPVPIVQPPPCIPLDPTCSALQDAANAIGAIQTMSCTANTTINEEVLAQWLYATDKNSPLSSNPNLQGLIDDYGLVTENLLNWHRVKTVRSYVNAKPKKSVTSAMVTAQLDNDPEPPKVERTILAFKSALKNLNTQVFDPESVEMTELIPNDMLVLHEIKTKFEAAYTIMDGTNPALGCNMKLEFFGAEPYVGVYKDPASFVYYAVKVTAKASLLFNPFPRGSPDERIELTAYAAAMPFGSRIGPLLKDTDFIKQGGQAWGGSAPRSTDYPYMKINDQISWADSSVLAGYHALLKNSQGAANGGAAVATGSVGKDDLIRGLSAAIMPDEFEVGKYNIPVDTARIGANARPSFDGKADSFESIAYYRHSVESGGKAPVDYTFWAPIIPPQGKDEFTDDVKNELEKIALFTGAGTGGPIQNVKNALKGILLTNLEKTIGTLQTNSNYNIARMPDPLSQVFFNANPPPPIIPGKIINPVKLATSFTTDHDILYFQNGRDGYSVKFIPFRMLLSTPGRLSNLQGEKKWTAIGDNLFGERTNLMKVAH